MLNQDYIHLVHKAQKGDLSAFSKLVLQFQDVVVGCAYQWLGNIESAKDVGQEAFLDAFQHLDQLRDAAAFPGWLRRIVYKHCDRITRRNELLMDTMPANMDAVSPELNPVTILEKHQTHEFLRFAVEDLPEPERQVVALHYFAESSGVNLATFLELPLSTIKKRLRSARSRLRKKGDSLMQESIDKIRPSNSEHFSQEIAFFLALRDSNRAEVKRLLEHSPSLVNAQQNWESEWVKDGILPFANKATALITAIERDDLEMLKLLLDSGAKVDGKCGCSTGEPPLWAAALLNRVSHVRVLLERGANPNVASTRGVLPLHISAMRGYRNVAQLLLENGANPNSLGTNSHKKNGKSAIEWAHENGNHDLGDFIATFHNKGNTSIDEQGASNAKRQLFDDNIINTGIKAVDLFSPISKGALIRMPFKAGVGMMVLLGELCHRFNMQDDGAVVWTGFTQPPFDLADWDAEVSEFGLKGKIHDSLAGYSQAPDIRREVFKQGLEKAETLCTEGLNVLAIVQSAEGFDIDVDSALLRLSEPRGDGSITTIIITSYPDNRKVWTEIKAPFSTQITLDHRRAKRNIFPAIDPNLTLSTKTTSGDVVGRYAELASKTVQLLDNYQKADPDFELVNSKNEEHKMKFKRELKIIDYFRQPFFITEPFTGKPGEWVGRDKMANELELLIQS